MDKAQLRLELQRMMLEMPEEQRSAASRRACRALVGTEEFRTASVVMLFLSLPHEVDTADAILWAWQQHKTVAVPKVSWQQRHMIPVKITTLETGLKADKKGLRVPMTGVPVPIEDIDLVVAPGLGFDKRGNRLGRGGSYYDRFFTNARLRAVRCGFGFAGQLVDEVPVTEEDVPVDLVVTDEGVCYCNDEAEKNSDGGKQGS